MNPQEQEPSAYKVAKVFYSLPNADRKWKLVISRLGVSGKQNSWENKLRKMLDEHERKKLVYHRVLKEAERYLPREPDLEEEMRRRFGLRAAVVVNISSLDRPKVDPGPDPNQQWDAYEDRIHQQLGVWGGRLVSVLLRPGDVLGTGGGRGLYYTAHNVFPSMASRRCGNVVSLTGQIGSDPDACQEQNKHYVDANDVANTLFAEFECAGSPIPVGSISEQKKGGPSAEGVTVALTGIGALSGRHRLKQYKRLQRLKPFESLLKSISDIAAEIEAIYRSQKMSFVHPVGDICNWCFLVDPGGVAERVKGAANLPTLLQRLNRKLLNTTPDRLQKIAEQGVVIAVAGGPHKAGALGHVLEKGRKEKPWISHVVTDHEVAQEILAGQQKV